MPLQHLNEGSILSREKGEKLIMHASKQLTMSFVVAFHHDIPKKHGTQCGIVCTTTAQEINEARRLLVRTRTVQSTLLIIRGLEGLFIELEGLH